MVFWYYDNVERVPVVNAWTQAERTVKMEGSEAIFNVSSRESLQAGPAFQSFLRAVANRDRAARGIRDFILRSPDRDYSIDATVVYCRIGDRSTTARDVGE